MVSPFYSDEQVTIFNADCMDVLPHLSDVHMVFTSPPYNMGVTRNGKSGFNQASLAAKALVNGYGAFDDAMDPSDYIAWQQAVLKACWDALADDGAIFYNHKVRVQFGRATMPTVYGGAALDPYLRQIITWDRGTCLNFSTSFYLPKSEWIIVWAKPSWRLRSKQQAAIGDVWRIGPEQDTSHPAPFPVALPRTAISSIPDHHKIVLDPFMGSGSTLVAARMEGKRAIGIELNERYCEIAVQRLSQIPLDFADRTDAAVQLELGFKPAEERAGGCGRD